MSIIAAHSQKSNEKKSFWITLDAVGQGIEWMDAGLPTPHYLHHHRLKYRYIAAWAIVGYFGTTAAKAFLLDVVARMLLAIPNAERLPWKPVIRESGHILEREPYELKELATRLPSLPWDTGKMQDHMAVANFFDQLQVKKDRDDGKRIRGDDVLFEATRWHLYRRAYAEGHCNNITEDYVRAIMEVENQLLTRPKDPSDVTSKARRMAEYMQNEFVIYDRKGYAEWSPEKRAAYMREYKRKRGIRKVTKTEAAATATAARQDRARAKVIGAITGLLAPEYRKKNGSWNIAKIAKYAGVSRNTAAKYVREWEDQQK